MTSGVGPFLGVDQLIQRHNIGFKLIPLGEDGKTPTIKSTNEVYHNPNYWTDEKITQEYSKFKNVATTFGKTHLKDPEGNDLYLNEIDIDSKEVFTRLAIIRAKDEERFFLDEMCKLTYVVKTRKKWGRRIFWLSHQQYLPISTRDCKLGFEFEIKTDNTLGHSTLPPSRHREDANFHYQSIGQQTIAIQDGLYDGISKLLSDCLKNKKPYDRKIATIHPNAACMNLDIILTDNDIEEIISQIKEYYRKGCRQNITLGLSGLLYKSGVGLESAEKVVVGLCNATSDEEKNSRMAALRNTYTKGQRGEELVGASLLSDVLTDGVANDLLNNITSVWNKYKNPILVQLQDHIRRNCNRM
jgi:hypothetical protein